jgi:hypothetical protein
MGDKPSAPYPGGPFDDILYDQCCCDRVLRDALGQFEHLLGRLTHEETQRITHGEWEALVQSAGNELLRRLIQGHSEQRSAEEPVRERVVGADGIARTHRRECCRRQLETRFGGGDDHPPRLRRAGCGKCFPPGCGAEPATGQIFARTARGASGGGRSRRRRIIWRAPEAGGWRNGRPRR